MTKLLKDASVGEYKLEHFEIPDNDLYALFHHIPSGHFVRLTHSGEVVMSNTQMEKDTNLDFVNHAHGDILIGGLGIGLVLMAIQDKKEVNSITVIEHSPEVIELIKDQLPLNDKVKIVLADVFQYVPNKKYNVIYLDIWNYINSDIYREEMLPLMEYYAEYLVSEQEDPNRYLDCWCKIEAMNDVNI